jgi:hypothetical protein
MNTPRRPQTIVSRLVWFGAGAVLSYLLIATPLGWLKRHTALPLWTISGMSTAVSVGFFFFWNYYVNFRTSSGHVPTLVRYLVVTCAMWFASSTVLTLLMHFHPAGAGITLGALRVNLNVVLTQASLAGFKFLLFHYWAFPVHREDGVSASSGDAPSGSAGPG